MKYYLERITSITAAIIFLQTLFFKFTAAPESVFIFNELGMEPYGRIGTGILELVIAGLLLIKRTTVIGDILGIGIILGAILSHLFILGIEVQNDGGLLFGLALLVFILLTINLTLQKHKLIDLIRLVRD